MNGMCEGKCVNEPTGIRVNLKNACDEIRDAKYKLFIMRNELAAEAVPNCDCEDDANLSMIDQSKLILMMSRQINEILDFNLRCLFGDN